MNEELEARRKERVKHFIDVLADYLIGNDAEMSIKLQLGKPEAKQWSELRSATPLFGYYESKEKAVNDLTYFLYGVDTL